MKNKSREELLKILQSDTDDKTKRKANIYLWHMMQSWSDEDLQQTIENGDDVEREHARWHLWRRNLDTSFENLLNIIKTSSDEDKIREAAFIIGEKKYPQAFDCLITLLKETDNDYIREGAAGALKELGDQRAGPFLCEQLRIHPNCAESITYALELFDCREVIDILVNMFVDNPKSLYLRLNIRSCFDNLDVKTLSKEILNNCLLKLEHAMQSTKDQENLKQLKDIYMILKHGLN